MRRNSGSSCFSDLLTLIFLFMALNFFFNTVIPSIDATSKSEGEPSQCFSFYRFEPVIESDMPFVINPSNKQGLSEEEFVSSVDFAIFSWESYAGNIFGEVTVDHNAESNHYDGVNTISFKEMSLIDHYLSGAIAGTAPIIEEGKIVEWDIVLDPRFDFGDEDINLDLFDLRSILIHEIGHALGLVHPDDRCNGEVMNASYKVNHSRTLGAGDIEGVQNLYQDQN